MDCNSKFRGSMTETANPLSRTSRTSVFPYTTVSPSNLSEVLTVMESRSSSLLIVWENAVFSISMELSWMVYSPKGMLVI